MNEDKLKLLKTTLETIQNGVTKAEFLKSFQSVMEVILRREKAINDFLSKMEVELKGKNSDNIKALLKMFDDLKKKDEETLESFMGKYEKQLTKALKDQADSLNFIRDTVRNLESGKDGKTPTKEELLAIITPLVPKAPEIPKEIMESYEVMEKEHEKLKKEIEDLKKRPTGRMGMKKITSVRSIDLTSQVDGLTKTFILPMDTLKVLGVWGTTFPITFRDDVDWTFNGRNLTLTDEVSAPESGQTLKVLIEAQFYA